MFCGMLSQHRRTAGTQNNDGGDGHKSSCEHMADAVHDELPLEIVESMVPAD